MGSAVSATCAAGQAPFTRRILTSRRGNRIDPSEFKDEHMHIEAPNLRENHPDRDLQCQDCIEGIVQEIIAEATRQGWESVETVQAMQEVLMRLRLGFAGGLDPEDPLNLAPQPYYDDQIEPSTLPPGRQLSGYHLRKPALRRQQDLPLT